MTKLNIPGLAVFITAFLVLSPLSQARISKGQSPQQLPVTKLTLALNWKAEPQFGGFYQAQLQNEFKKNHLDVTIQEGGSGTPTIQMLTFKKVDIAVVSAEEILISNQNNPKNPVMALYAVFQTSPQILMTRAERGIQNLKDLFSKPGIISAQSGLTYVSFLKAQYPNSPVKWVPYLGGISGLYQLDDYAQQGFLTSEPFLAEKDHIRISTFLIADAGFNPYTTVVAVRKADYQKRKAQLDRFIQAIDQGWRRYLTDPSQANQFMNQLNSTLDLETFRKSAEAQKKLIQQKGVKLGSMSQQRWEDLIQTLLDLKVLKKKLPAEDQYANSLEKVSP